MSKRTASEYAGNNIIIYIVVRGRIQTNGVIEIFIEVLREEIKVVIPIRRYEELVKFTNIILYSVVNAYMTGPLIEGEAIKMTPISSESLVYFIVNLIVF